MYVKKCFFTETIFNFEIASVSSTLKFIYTIYPLGLVLFSLEIKNCKAKDGASPYCCFRYNPEPL